MFSFFQSCLLTLFCATFSILQAQAAQELPQQTLRGQVLESSSLRPVAGAQVVLSQNGVSSQQAFSDSLGNFTIIAPVGRYQVRVVHVGYQPYQISDLLVSASRQSPLRLILQEYSELLGEATVVGQALPSAPNSIGFSVEETQRTPATFWDPARFISTAPGVSTVNDQANHLSVRGLSPWAVQWRLQGLPILNPNHLANAGTLQDRAAYAGGGVNILSGQLLNNSQFWLGHYPAAYGGALGGIFGMQLRPGSTEQAHHTLQASLLGLDAATEGPLGKSGASYLVNYRYSTVGLLSDLGVDFGNEAIRFQDLSLHLNIPVGLSGQLSFFALGGLSRNERSPLEDPADWETERDALLIDYSGKMGAVGTSLELPLRKHMSLTAALAYSARSDERQEALSLSAPQMSYTGQDSLNEQLLSGRLQLQGNLQRWEWQAGLEGSYGYSKGSAADQVLRPTVNSQTVYYQGSLQQTRLSPYAMANWQLARRWQAQLGLRYDYWTEAQEGNLQPRLQLEWQASAKSILWFQAGRTAQQLPSPLLLELDNDGFTTDYKLLINSVYSSLGQQWQFSPTLALTTELFYHHLDQVLDSPTGFSSLNYLDDTAPRYLSSNGEGSIMGISTQLHRQFVGGYFFKLNATLLRTSTDPGTGTGRRFRYDPGWSTTALWGKEWKKEKEEALRTIGLFARTSIRGGYYLPVVDTEASASAGRTYWNYQQQQQLPTYFTLDLRLSLTKEKKEYTRTLSLDLQNLTGRENLAGYYYDRLLEEPRPLQQLGLVPVLAYRVEF